MGAISYRQDPYRQAVWGNTYMTAAIDPKQESTVKYIDFVSQHIFKSSFWDMAVGGL